MKIMKTVLATWMSMTFIACGGGEDSPNISEPMPPIIDAPKVEITSIVPEIKQSGETIEVSFNSTDAWSILVDSNADWLQVTPTSGEKGIHKLSVKIEANESYDDRITVVTITAGTASEKFTVKQKKKEEIPLNGSIDDLPINNWEKE